MTEPTDIAALNFEDALSALEDIVRRLEGGQIKLDDAVEAYTRGVALKAHCQSKLEEARARVEKIAIGPDGAARAEPAGLE